jgi:hypothetical protein
VRAGDLPQGKEFGAKCAPVLLEVKELAMKITKCQNRFEVIVEDLNQEEAENLVEEFEQWVMDKEMPDDEVFLAALGPCGK